jgi:hypothetical protein
MLKRPWIALVRGQIDRVAMLSSISRRAARFLPNLIYIIPLFVFETATRSRVATPDSAIAVSLMSTLGGGAGSVKGILMIYQSQEDGKD